MPMVTDEYIDSMNEFRAANKRQAELMLHLFAEYIKQIEAGDNSQTLAFMKGWIERFGMHGEHNA